MANIVCKSWKVVKVEIKKKFYWNCWLCPYNRQIKPHPARWQYHLINYLGRAGWIEIFAQLIQKLTKELFVGVFAKLIQNKPISNVAASVQEFLGVWCSIFTLKYGNMGCRVFKEGMQN